MPFAIEEFLRAYSPVTMAREVMKETTVSGCPVKPGNMVLLSFPAANRDPAMFPDADKVIIDRKENRHAAFGLGIHRCVGSNLARMEMTVALEEWLKRIPEFSLDPTGHRDLVRRHGARAAPASVAARLGANATRPPMRVQPRRPVRLAATTCRGSVHAFQNDPSDQSGIRVRCGRPLQSPPVASSKNCSHSWLKQPAHEQAGTRRRADEFISGGDYADHASQAVMPGHCRHSARRSRRDRRHTRKTRNHSNCATRPARPPKTPWVMQLERFAKDVDEESKGALKIEQFIAAQLGNEQDTAQQIARGRIDMGGFSNGAVALLTPEISAARPSLLFQGHRRAGLHARQSHDQAGQRRAGEEGREVPRLDRGRHRRRDRQEAVRLAEGRRRPEGRRRLQQGVRRNVDGARRQSRMRSASPKSPPPSRPDWSTCRPRSSPSIFRPA